MTAVQAVRNVLRTVREENVPFKAASIAYYALASFVPLLALALTLLSLVGMADLLVAALRSTLSTSGVRVLDTVLSNTDGRKIAGVLGLGLTVWSASKVFRGLTIAFEEVYDTGADLSMIDQFRKSLIVVAALLSAFVLLAGTSLVLERGVLAGQYTVPVGNALAMAGLVPALLPFYYVLPPTETTVRHSLPGTLVAAAGWILLQVAFFYYVRTSGDYSAYGFLGAVLVFVTFLYFAANVLLVGAVVNVVLDR